MLCTTSDYQLQDMLKVYMFYTDTEHRVEPVTRGYRILLQYDILVDNNVELPVMHEKDRFHYDTDVTGLFTAMDEDESSSPISLRTFDLFNECEFNEECANNIITFFKNASLNRIPGLMMSHLYPIANIEPATLRGFDKLLYKVLNPHFDIEFMPVYLFAENPNDLVSHCVSLHRNRAHHEKRELTLFVTPASTSLLFGTYMGGNNKPASHLNYVAVCMILNGIDETIKKHEKEQAECHARTQMTEDPAYHELTDHKNSYHLLNEAIAHCEYGMTPQDERKRKRIRESAYYN